ncbi:MAG: tryptophan synthase subunit alpha [bacterium]|nr:tryptophan synthase subunit alpha [bacterium]
MSRIQNVFYNLNKQNRAALIAYITAGDPDLKTTKTLVLTLAKSGADIIELGIPFSDPIADGPTIQKASQRALAKGTRLQDVIALVKELRKETDIPLVFMSYYNPILQYGIKKFTQDAINAGVDGIIVPDLPPEEAGELISAARKTGLDTIFLLAPTSTQARIKLVADRCSGFVYYVSLTGVTGARTKIATDVAASIKKIKRLTDKPVAVGFGISNAAQVRQVVNWGADGVIVGSAIVNLIEQNIGKKDLVNKVAKFVKELSTGTKC